MRRIMKAWSRLRGQLAGGHGDARRGSAITQLCGTGCVGSVTGGGWISPGAGGAGRLQAQSVGGGVDFAFRFTTAGDNSAGNDTLELRFSAAPFSKILDADNRIYVYLDVLPPEDGYVLGGFATASSVDFTRWIALASWHFFVLDPYGTEVFEGQTYAPCPVALNLSTVAAGSGRMLKISRPTHGYAAWCAEWFTLAERTDVAVSGPLAVGADGVANLLRYALGAGRTEPITPYLPRLDRVQMHWLPYRTRVDEQAGATSSSGLHRRSDRVRRILADAQQDKDSRYVCLTRKPRKIGDRDHAARNHPGPSAPVRFFRLRVQQNWRRESTE